jgi:hypothetical protein
MRSFYLFLVMLLLPLSAQAQDSFYNEIPEHYDIHGPRIDYHYAHNAERSMMDSRRQAYQQPREWSLENYRSLWQDGRYAFEDDIIYDDSQYHTEEFFDDDMWLDE